MEKVSFVFARFLYLMKIDLESLRSNVKLCRNRVLDSDKYARTSRNLKDGPRKKKAETIRYERTFSTPQNRTVMRALTRR